MKKNIFLTLLIIIVLYVIFPYKVFATEASLSCAPSTGTYCTNETIVVDYIINTRTFPVFGADISAGFTASVLQPIGTQSTPVTSTTLWTAPLTNTIDAAVGGIRLDYGNAQPSYTGNTSIGKISFKAISAGQAQLYYNFQQQYDDTTPGVAKIWGKKDGVTLSNILTDVNNCIYIIEDCNPTTGPTSPPQPTTPSRPTVTTIPDLGTTETGMVIFAVAGLFLITGFFLPKIVKL
jgi:hypothetical protein